MNDSFFDLAFEEAQKALKKNEVPIGAVIVKDGKVLARKHNIKETEKCATCHAEILAINEASSVLGNWRLDGCDIYVTLNPCPMCASAIRQARISNVYSALENLNDNNKKIIDSIFNVEEINPSLNFISNLNVDRSKELLQSFFKNKR